MSFFCWTLILPLLLERMAYINSQQEHYLHQVITKQRQDKHSDMYCLIVISAGCLPLLKQLLAQMFSTLARPSNCSLVKEHPPYTFCPISRRGSKFTWISAHPGASFTWSLRITASALYMHIWGEKLCVAVVCRNRTLFRCVFQQHYCVQNAVVQNLFKGWTFMQTTQPATEISREIWLWSIASPPRGWVYHPCAQCGIIVNMKTH